MNRERLRENLEAVRGRIAEAARRSGREPAEVTLVAVTKRNPVEAVRPLVELGAADLGENYPQELWAKAAETADLPVRWHLIGHLQTNKIRRTVPLVVCVHGVDSLKLLTALNESAAAMRAEGRLPPEVFLQVNASSEASKHGWTAEGILADAPAIAELKAVPIAGLMTMAAFNAEPEATRPTFEHLRKTRDALRERTGLALKGLSMGMSNDFAVAVEEGATHVRVGSALFEGVMP